MKLEVYNLEFCSWCREMTIFGYRFVRVEEYRERVLSLQHCSHLYSEFKITPNTGQHAVTAHVVLPKKQERAILGSSERMETALSDVLLLLSLFTRREVFVTDGANENTGAVLLRRDPRMYFFGGTLPASLPYKEEPVHNAPQACNIGFEQGLNQVYALIRGEEWQHKYAHGYFLFLAQQAFRAQPLASAFIQCWTIWEHLFTVLNRTWMSDKQIRNLSAYEKIAFLLVQYALRDEIREPDRTGIKSFANIRHRLVHFGRFPTLARGTVYKKALFFIDLTEFIITKILGLKPSDLFDTLQNLEKFMSEIRQKQRKELNELVGKTSPAKPRKKEKKPTRAPKGKEIVLAQYLSERMKLKAKYKGKTIKATAWKDGRIYFDGKLYNSPSAAASAAVKHKCNGWLFWHYQRAPGDWVPLRELRK